MGEAQSRKDLSESSVRFLLSVSRLANSFHAEYYEVSVFRCDIYIGVISGHHRLSILGQKGNWS